jgi:plasmid stabilization system protein ParE
VAFRIKITSGALRDLKDIGRTPGAEEYALRLLERAHSLVTFPYRHGTLRGRPHIRKAPLESHLILSKIYDDRQVVEILRFWHAARDQRRLRLKEEAAQPYEAVKVGA